MNDKRSHDRFSLWFPVTVDGDSGQVWAICEDASAGGIRIAGSDELGVGDEVTVVFRISPDDPEERRVPGRIVRVERPDDDPRAVWPHRMAIEFLEPVPELTTTFKRASTRPPPPSPDPE